MIAFVEEHRDEFGVEPICDVIEIAPSTYYEAKRCERDPARRSARRQRDEFLKVEIRRIYDENHQVYGVRKVWIQANREGISVAKCTVQRPMRDMGLRGATRGKGYLRSPSAVRIAATRRVRGPDQQLISGDIPARWPSLNRSHLGPSSADIGRVAC